MLAFSVYLVCNWVRSSIDERVSIGHHTAQFGNYRIGCEGNVDFHNQKNSGRDAQPIGNKHQQITDQADQGEGKRKGSGHLLEICSIESTCWSKRMKGFPFQGNVCN